MKIEDEFTPPRGWNTSDVSERRMSRDPMNRPPSHDTAPAQPSIDMPRQDPDQLYSPEEDEIASVQTPKYILKLRQLCADVLHDTPSRAIGAKLVLKHTGVLKRLSTILKRHEKRKEPSLGAFWREYETLTGLTPREYEDISGVQCNTLFHIRSALQILNANAAPTKPTSDRMSWRSEYRMATRRRNATP